MNNKLNRAIKGGKTAHIGVESANFMHLLILKIAEDPRFSNICLWDFDGEMGSREEWLKNINAQLDRGITGIGIICDIDMPDAEPHGMARRIESVKSLFQNTCDVNFNDREIVGDNPFYGYHIVPSQSQNGCLETALLENPTAHSNACVNSFAACLEDGNDFNNNKKDKVKVRSLMLSRDPEMPFSATANTDLWDWNTGSLGDMLQFLEDMNSHT